MTLTNARALIPRQARKPRIALYSHDTCGLGHIRRNLLIAQTLGEALPEADILMITGARYANAFPVSPRVDMLTLPALFKQSDGRYRPRHFSFCIDEFIALRSKLIRMGLEQFRPDVFIVDNVPRGAMGELSEALSYLRKHTATRCVLGLRDILDHPDTVRREWARADNRTAIREHYDAVWIYGDPAVYDAAAAYGFPADIQARLSYTGYLDPRRRLDQANGQAAAPAVPDQPFSLCAAGGGQDGLHLARQYAAAARPADTEGLILTGPFMGSQDRRQLEAFLASRPHLHLIRFAAEPTVLYRRAERVVSMGGYNTVCELMALGKPTLIVPRVKPRQEQLIRATRLEALGLVAMLHPDEATPAAISRWLHEAAPMQENRRRSLDMRGLPRIVDHVRALLPAVHLRPADLQPQKCYASC